jgi:hypothetical protein
MRPGVGFPVLTALVLQCRVGISDIFPGVDVSVDVRVDVHSSRWAT